MRAGEVGGKGEPGRCEARESLGGVRLGRACDTSHISNVVISVACHSKNMFHQVQKSAVENCGRILEGAMACDSFKQRRKFESEIVGA